MAGPLLQLLPLGMEPGQFQNRYFGQLRTAADGMSTRAVLFAGNRTKGNGALSEDNVHQLIQNSLPI